MAISLGTRSRTNIRWGPGEVYIAEGATIGAPTDFGEEITQSALTTLLGSFHHLGSLEENPRIETDPLPQSQIDPGDDDVIVQRQHQDEVKAELTIVEIDNDMVNEMLGRYEGATRTDFLWLRSTEIGDYIGYLRNVPFLLAMRREHRWEEVERMLVTVQAKTTQIKLVHGQKKIIADS